MKKLEELQKIINSHLNGYEAEIKTSCTVPCTKILEVRNDQGHELLSVWNAYDRYEIEKREGQFTETPAENIVQDVLELLLGELHV